MAAILSWVLIVAGAIFMLLAAIGVLRMPDLYTRMHSSTKSATLGVGCIILGAALYFNDLAIGTRALAIILFFFLTAPVAAHMIGRAAFISGVPLWEGTRGNELEGRYNPRTHQLASGPAGRAADRAGERPNTPPAGPAP